MLRTRRSRFAAHALAVVATSAGSLALVVAAAAPGGAILDDTVGETTETTLIDETVETVEETFDTVAGDEDDELGGANEIVSPTSTTTSSTSSTSTTSTTQPAQEEEVTEEPSRNASSGSPFGDLMTEQAEAAPAASPSVNASPPSVSSAAAGAAAALGAAAEAAGPAPVATRVLDVDASILAEALGNADPSLPLVSGGRTSARVLHLLAGMDLPPAVLARILAPFPVAGYATYTDDWGAPRTVPTLHSHEGTDIFAARGTPVIASADGEVSRLREGTKVGGTSLRLTTSDGTFFYYAHLSGFAPTIYEGKTVRRGDVLGFVGNTGNAVNTPDHLHYEIHPRGGKAVNPAPYLDKWLEEARAAALAISGAPAEAVEALARNTNVKRTPVAAPADPRIVNTRDAAATSTSSPLGSVGLVLMVAIFGWAAGRVRRRVRPLAGRET